MRRTRFLRWAGAVLGSLTLAAAACAAGANGRITASGTIEATEADLGFQTGGRLDSVLVREGDQVPAGARLAVLDRAELLARRESARAFVLAQQARLRELERGFRSEEVEQARAALRAAEQRVGDTERDRARTRALFEGGAVSRQAFDNQESAFTLAAAERDRLREQVRLLETGARPEQVAAQRAVVAQAVAGLRQVEAALAQAEVVAPFAGFVTHRQREPGEVVSPGLPVVTLSNPADRWVRIYVPEDEVGRVRLGAPAEISIDAFPGKTYQGEVAFIATEAEFTPRNVQTQAERVKLVYRVKVRIVADTVQELKPGIPADVRLQGS